MKEILEQIQSLCLIPINQRQEPLHTKMLLGLVKQAKELLDEPIPRHRNT